MCICKCECGKETKARLNSLKSGYIKSCGCSKFNNPLIIEDLTGKKFNRLTVIERDFKKDQETKDRLNRSGNIHWICKCDCGNTTSATGYQLKNNKVKSCGCYNSEMLAKRNKLNSTKINKVCQHKSNNINNEGNYSKIYNENLTDYFIVDVDDCDFIMKWFWRIDDKGYWVTNAKKEDIEKYNKKTLRVHQLIAERKYGEYDTKTLFPDHLSRNKSDNRKSNLILKSNAENMKNRTLSKSNVSGKTGVYYKKDTNKYISSITINYKTIYLGAFNTLEEATDVRKEAELKYGFTCDDIFPKQESIKQNKIITEEYNG